MKSRKYSLSKTRLIIFLQFFFILMPEVFTQFRISALLFAVIQMLLFLDFALFKRKDKYPIYTFIWILISVYLLSIMIFNGNLSDVDRWGRLSVTVVDAILMMEHYIKRGKAKDVLVSLSSLGVTYFLLNTVSIVFLKGIIDKGEGLVYYFLGLRTDFMKYFFVFFLANGLNYLYFAEKKKLILFLILSVSNFVFFDVSTAIVSLLVLMILIIFSKTFYRILNIKTSIIFCTILNISFVFFNASNRFAWLIQGFLKKDVTLTNRVYIWQEAIRMITNNMISCFWGHGIVNSGAFVKMGRYWPAHNQLLQWLFEYGVFGWIIILVFFVSLDRAKQKGKDTYLAYIVFFTMMIASITSSPFIIQMGYVSLLFLPYLDDFRAIATENWGWKEDYKNEKNRFMCSI